MNKTFFTFYLFQMQLHLLLIACIVSLATSLSVPSLYLLNALEARLFLLGQIIMVWELFCRGESLKLLSLNIAAVVFLFSMCFKFSPTTHDEPPNVFILLALAYLGLAILLVDPLKHSRTLLAPSTPLSDDPDDCIEFRKLPYYAPHLFRLVDPFEDSDDDTSMIQPWPMAQLHGALLHGDGDSSLSDSESSDGSLSTIEEEQDNLEELLAPHLEELLGELFPPHLPPLALPG